MTTPRASRSTHERNLERDLEQRLEEASVARPGQPARDDVPSSDDAVAARMARRAAEREASRRAHERAPGHDAD